MPTQSHPPQEGLEREIAVLRQLLAQVAGMCSSEQNERSLAEMLRVLDILSLASTRLAVLLKAQQTLGQAGREDWGVRFEQALAEVLEEFRAPPARAPRSAGGRRSACRPTSGSPAQSPLPLKET